MKVVEDLGAIQYVNVKLPRSQRRKSKNIFAL